MDLFTYQNGELFAESVPVAKIAAEVGTPVYIYSKNTLINHYQKIASAFAPLNPLICYSIKSCGNLSIVRTLVNQGSGMDITSGGELFRALQAGADPQKIVYSGVGKTDKEIKEALLAQSPGTAVPGLGIRCFNVESEEEFWNLDRLAKSLNLTAHAAIRVNPDVANKGNTHQKTFTGKKETKFGIDIDRAANFYRQVHSANKAGGGGGGAGPGAKLTALDLHIGSPIKVTEPYTDAITKALALIDELANDGIIIDTLDIGGGFAAYYEGNEAPPATTYAQAIVPLFKSWHGRPAHGPSSKNLQIILEPGRSISCNAGILLAQVQYTKIGGTKKFIIIDAAMNDLIRPTLYEAYHFIWPTQGNPPANRLSSLRIEGDEKVDVVGPICESGDYLAKDRYLPPLHRGDLLAIYSAGAYGMSMASNYNARPRAAEVLVDGDSYTVIRKRETYEDLIALEQNP